MVSYFFSFGQDHVHQYGDVTLDCDCIVQIDAPSDGAARQRMFQCFGPRWSIQYTAADLDLTYFPRGIVLQLRVE